MKKIVAVIILMLLIGIAIIGSGKYVNTLVLLDDPPRDIDWTSNSNRVADWLGMDITANGHTGRVESVEDTNGDGLVGYCDYVVINWRNLNTRQPYWKYHCEEGEYVDDPQDPDYGRWKFEFDYKSKSRNAPKIYSCCHYVDDDNTAGPWDGSFENPYNKIQDAIDHAITGDQIYVLPGTYNENIVMDKPLVLAHHLDYFVENVEVFGGNSGSTVTITADYCTVVGILVRGWAEAEESAGIICHSNYNNIYGCDITDNVNGVYLLDSASNNKIIENDIHGNDFNFFVGSDPFDNLIYYNQFYDPDHFNAKDLGTNQWDDEEDCGNYWDDYEGEDTNGDGIGDDPHPILGGINFDNYPKMNKTMYPFNKNPYIGKFEGKTKGTTGEQYGYAVMFYDDEYHDGILEIDWDDGSSIEYSEYLGAEQEYEFFHTWSNDGTYNVKVRAIDTLGGKSDWETLEVSMPKSQNFNTWHYFWQKIIEIFPIFREVIRPLKI